MSADNIDAVFAVGGTPYIAFKSNSSGAVGGLFQKMFHYYAANREEYMAHYHKRSNVESVMSMVKAKFGDAVRSKNEAAMKNEALCKLLAHNLCCLIMSQVELGIEPVFWGGDGATPNTAGATAVSVPDAAPAAPGPVVESVVVREAAPVTMAKPAQEPALVPRPVQTFCGA